MTQRNTKTAMCAAIRRAREPEKEYSFTARPVQINQPCVFGNVSKDITLSRISNDFSVVFQVLLFVYTEE